MKERRSCKRGAAGAVALWVLIGVNLAGIAQVNGRMGPCQDKKLERTGPCADGSPGRERVRKSMKAVRQRLMTPDTKLPVTFQALFIFVDARKIIPDAPEIGIAQFPQVMQKAKVGAFRCRL